MKTEIVIELPRLDGHERIALSGRVAWTLLALIAAGDRGVTPIERPAPRWSDYVHRLRSFGVDIETIREPHGGPFPGEHGRYVLRSQVRVVEPLQR